MNALSCLWICCPLKLRWIVGHPGAHRGYSHLNHTLLYLSSGASRQNHLSCRTITVFIIIYLEVFLGMERHIIKCHQLTLHHFVSVQFP